MRMMRLTKQFLAQVRAGRKTLEVRVGYPGLRSIRPGDRIRMVSGKEEQVVRVEDVREYESHEEMLEAEDHARIAPHIPSRQGVLELLQQIYPPEKAGIGIVVLEIRAEGCPT